MFSSSKRFYLTQLKSNEKDTRTNKLKTDSYHFLKIDTDIFRNFFTEFGQLPIFYLPPIPIFQNLLTDIFDDILTKHFG